MNDDELAAIRAAEIKAGLDWTLENAHPLLMAIGPLVAALAEARAERDAWSARAAREHDGWVAERAALAEAHRTLADVEARTWDEGYAAAEYMAKCWGHVDYWEDEPANPYRASGAESAGRQA